MPRRRRPPFVRTLLPICNDREYWDALAELLVLQTKPLGTPETEGLQELIEAILAYEAEHGFDDEPPLV